MRFLSPYPYLSLSYLALSFLTLLPQPVHLRLLHKYQHHTPLCRAKKLSPLIVFAVLSPYLCTFISSSSPFSTSLTPPFLPLPFLPSLSSSPSLTSLPSPSPTSLPSPRIFSLHFRISTTYRIHFFFFLQIFLVFV